MSYYGPSFVNKNLNTIINSTVADKTLNWEVGELFE